MLVRYSNKTDINSPPKGGGKGEQMDKNVSQRATNHEGYITLTALQE